MHFVRTFSERQVFISTPFMSYRAWIKQPLIQDDYRVVTVQKIFHYSVTTQYQQALTGLELVMLCLQRILFTHSRETFITSAAQDNKQWAGLCWMKRAELYRTEVHAGVEYMPLACVCSPSVIKIRALKRRRLIWCCNTLSRWNKTVLSQRYWLLSNTKWRTSVVRVPLFSSHDNVIYATL